MIFAFQQQPLRAQRGREPGHSGQRVSGKTGRFSNVEPQGWKGPPAKDGRQSPQGGFLGAVGGGAGGTLGGATSLVAPKPQPWPLGCLLCWA